MKLLLTSAGSRVKDELLKFIPQPYNQTKIAYITTAAKVEPDAFYLNAENKFLKGTGCQVEEMDFVDCDKEDCRKLLEDKNLIYIQGGNTFYLLKILKESGAFDVIKEKVESGVPYVGVSAGSYVACPTIEMATWSHQDKNHRGLEDFTAFGFVPFLMSVHYKDKYKEILKEEMKKTDLEVKILKDGQALLVEGKDVELVGDKEENKL